MPTSTLTANGVTYADGTSATSAKAFPTGTALLFQQTAAPVGWTKSTTHNDKALRVVSGTASNGGSTVFSTVFASKTPSGSVSISASTGAYTIATADMPSHNHEMAYGSENLGLGWGQGSTSSSWRQSFNPNTYPRPLTSPTGGGGGHSHSVTGSGTFTGSALDFSVQYVDTIIATKD
jgi:hypothetical protein